MKFLKHLFIFLFCYICSTSFANGWQAIEKNNNLEAEKKFLKTLKEDSINYEALIGMLYIAELKQDHLDYKKYSKRFVKAYPDNVNLFLFSNKLENSYDQIKDLDVDKRLILNAQIKKAEHLFYNRKFEESKKIINRIQAKLNWKLIGPFENLNGSGFGVVYEPEITSKTKNYDKYIYPFQKEWIEIIEKQPLGGINFRTFLPKTNNYSTYYAKSSFELSEQQEITLSIARNTPLKIWVDNTLVFSNDKNTFDLIDAEQIHLELSEGIHNILVKSAKLDADMGRSNLFSISSYSYDYSSRFGFDFFNSYGNGNNKSKTLDYYYDFLIRLLDKNDNQLKINYEADGVQNDGKVLSINESQFNSIDYIDKKMQTAQNKLPYYYLLEKVYSKSKRYAEGEEFIYNLHKKDKSSFYLKYLLAKMYEKNNKKSELYLLLENIDYDKTPIFSLLLEKFKSVDKDADEKNFLNKLAQLERINPKHHKVVKSYISYYEDKGLSKEKIKYLTKLVKDYPELNSKYSKYLEDEDYKPEIYKAKTDEEKKEEAMKALARLDTFYNSYDYSKLITYYKNQEQNDSVLYFYDQLIKYDPTISNNIINKSKFLYGLERYDEAEETLKDLLKKRKNNTQALQLMGDINSDLKHDKEAISYYEKYLEVNALSPAYYKYNSIVNKIYKIKEEEDYSKYYRGKSLENVLKNKKWEGNYEGEDAFIIYYSEDIVFKKYEKIDVVSKVAIKIITEDASRDFTELDYSHFGKLTTVKIIKENGTEVIPDYQNSYIVCKNLTPGDIIVVEGIIKDVSYLKNTVSQSLNKEFTINSDYPIFYTKFQLVAQEEDALYISYHNMEHLKKEPKIEKKNKMKIYLWEYDNPQKFVAEDGSLYNWELYSFIFVSSVKNWNQVVQWYDKITYKKLDFNYELKEILDSLDVYDLPQQKQVEKIYNYITEHINYSNVSFLQSNYVPKSSNVTCSDKIGDCKDVATIMIAFLRELGIESYYTLVRTHNYSRLNLPPSLSFDHAIAAYRLDNEKDFKYLDITSDYSPYFTLNYMDVDAYALLVKDGVNFISKLPDDQNNKSKNKSTYKTIVDFKNNNAISIQSNAEYFGLVGGYLKETFARSSKEETKTYLNEYVTNPILKNVELDSFAMYNETSISKPLEINYNLQLQDFTSIINDLVIFRIPFLAPTSETNAFNKKERIHDFYPNYDLNMEPSEEEVVINIPKEHKIPRLPKDLVIKNEFFDYSLTFSKKENSLVVNKKIILLKNKIEKSNFEKFGEFYRRITKAENQQLYIINENADSW